MQLIKKTGIAILVLLTLMSQFCSFINANAEDDQQESGKKIELKAENKAIENEDIETLSMDEPYEEDSSTAADPSENLTYVTFDATISDGVSKEGDKYIWHANSNASGHGVSYRVNYSIIKGTHIADLSITEMVVKQMEQVAAGDDAQKYLDQIEGLIMEDIKKNG